jgi:Uma2 family endonuclease
MKVETVRTRRWSRLEYERLVDQGFFGPDDRLELIQGHLIVKEPQNAPHVMAIALVADVLRAAFGPGWFVRQQFPLALGDWSEPEPDVSVVQGSPRDYPHAHPNRPVLVVEVSESRLRFDRTDKAAIYARAGIADYWIVNLVDRVLEVHRDPERSGRQWRYRSVQRVAPDGEVSPLAAPGARIRVADLLP